MVILGVWDTALHQKSRSECKEQASNRGQEAAPCLCPITRPFLSSPHSLSLSSCAPPLQKEGSGRTPWWQQGPCHGVTGFPKTVPSSGLS